MKTRIRLLCCAVAVPLALLAACNDDDPTQPSLPPEIQQLHASLAPFEDFTNATKPGAYAAKLTECLANGAEGAMGIHYANTSYIDALADKAHPEALIFEPGANGKMTLVGVEYIVPFDLVPKTSPAPVLYGQAFMPIDEFGVWGLHVWTHRNNPSGTFAMWNPRVSC